MANLSGHCSIKRPFEEGSCERSVDKTVKSFLLSVWDHGHKTSVFDRLGESFLVFHAVSAVISWDDFKVLSGVFSQNCKIFIIHFMSLVDAELAFSFFITWHKLVI